MKCASCGGVATNQCGGCNAVVYCGRQCQIASWETHRFQCIGVRGKRTVEERESDQTEAKRVYDIVTKGHDGVIVQAPNQGDLFVVFDNSGSISISRHPHAEVNNPRDFKALKRIYNDFFIDEDQGNIADEYEKKNGKLGIKFFKKLYERGYQVNEETIKLVFTDMETGQEYYYSDGIKQFDNIPEDGLTIADEDEKSSSSSSFSSEEPPMKKFVAKPPPPPVRKESVQRISPGRLSELRREAERMTKARNNPINMKQEAYNAAIAFFDALWSTEDKTFRMILPNGVDQELLFRFDNTMNTNRVIMTGGPTLQGAGYLFDNIFAKYFPEVDKNEFIKDVLNKEFDFHVFISPTIEGMYVNLDQTITRSQFKKILMDLWITGGYRWKTPIPDSQQYYGEGGDYEYYEPSFSEQSN